MKRPNPFLKTSTLTLALALSALGLAGASQAATGANGERLMNGKSVYGVPAAASSAVKEINVDQLSTLNVNCGDTLSFRRGEQSFTWKFDVVGHRIVDLQKIAPAGFIDKPLLVYVDRNESERN
ncbi:hypothetical protein HNP55_002326 [Paucibacter oligotrophus]|uniref:Heavy-metal resistance protein CzcE n=1 Tax=Roseateles oligotrophus TaxID=1769250 RepID=A0A840LAR3_9BURK|nr:CzcE family metal-binding protein [Roseateles oligotrophus]MBB4843803.1 hypothetical protein [Roseateles oligotrophus]